MRDPTSAVANVDDYASSAKLLAATTLRNILGTKTLADILSERESIAHDMQVSLDEATEPWGVYVERVEVKDVRVPEQLQRAMAAEAEAAREARAKVIAAEGEHKASRSLRHAAEIITESPAALQVKIEYNSEREILSQYSVTILANTQRNFCGKQQHHYLPGPHRHHVKLHAVQSAGAGAQPTTEPSPSTSWSTAAQHHGPSLPTNLAVTNRHQGKDDFYSGKLLDIPHRFSRYKLHTSLTKCFCWPK